MPTIDANGTSLGAYLRTRRTKLDPAALELAVGRRRTPGLRREEVAQRANISTTWYTWLEQGRGGRPSAEVLDRLARALLLTEVEREHLFLLGLGRTPEVRYGGVEPIAPHLQRVLDAMPGTPAMIRTVTWDIVAWNRAASAVLLDFGALTPAGRKILRLMFCDPQMRAAQLDWKSVARFLVSAFRVDAARAGAAAEVEPLVRELCAASREFAALWREHDLQLHRGAGVKHLRHPRVGRLSLEYSVFAVDARPELKLVVLNPATAEDHAHVQVLTRDSQRRAKGKPVRRM